MEFHKVLENNMPFAKLDKDGNIIVERPITFEQDYKESLKEHKAEILKKAFKVALLGVAGLGLSALGIIPPEVPLLAQAFIAGGSIYVMDPVYKYIIAKTYTQKYDPKLSEALQEEYDKGNYLSVSKEGVVEFPEGYLGKTKGK